ncbi:MAG: hypothetical protein WBP85_16270 [Terracidiphilus sp.]
MKTVKWLGAVGAFGLLLAGAPGAQAAGSYTLTCNAAKSGTITMALTGFTIKLNGAEDAATGSAAGKRSAFAVTIRFAPGKDYETLWSMVQDNEELRSCKLTDTEGGAGVTATDDWTASSSKEKKSKLKNNAPPAAMSGGGYEWILSDATVTSLTAIGRETTTGAADGEMEATIDAQQITFTM